ncbi:expressed unknown protein [Seminavis robusta]|uniref:Transmembrane protein n=1 Tax=Seminavis robusta TaxID=568900 RepID=A0A9N8H9H7_9STRA|nr:expressed unknown protein [Seminavis robusta]|eukprot:Sro255_g100340.1 n/a (178) ;mRNA; f:25050-25583
MSNLLDTVEGYIWGNSTDAVVNGTMYPVETLPPATCDEKMTQPVEVYWTLVGSMLVLFLATFVLPFICFCCKNHPRCLARIFFFSGLIKLIIGSLLASVLLPQCPIECGEFFCGVHKYSPGPVYGIIFIIIGLLWLCRGCALKRSAKKQELEREAERATAGLALEPSVGGKRVPDIV